MEDGEERLSIEGGRILVEENGETLWDSADPPISRWQSFAFPVLVTLVFLALGFFGGWWHPGWLVFLTIPLYYSVVDVVTRKKSWKHFAYPVLVTLVFLALGILGGWWHPGWLVFLTIPLYYSLFPEKP